MSKYMQILNILKLLDETKSMKRKDDLEYQIVKIKRIDALKDEQLKDMKKKIVSAIEKKIESL